MKLSNNIIAVAILSAVSVPALAADVSIYGKANVTVQSSDDGDGSYTEVKSNASRIGFKGTHELEEGLEVVYKAEFEVDIDGDGDTFKGRNQYIGLRGAFGEVLLGKNDTVLKQSQGKVDLFSDLNGDIKNLWAGENRMADTVTYKSPKFSGLQFGLTYIAEDSTDGDNAYSMSLAYGDAKLKKSDIYASIAMDSEVKGYDVTRATVQGKVSGITLGAMLQTQEKADGSAEMDGFMVSAKYTVDNVTFKGQLQRAEFDGGDDKSGFTLGADYKLAKNTKLFAFYTSFDLDSAEDKEYLAAGIEYKF
jgi:predicted porin